MNVGDAHFDDSFRGVLQREKEKKRSERVVKTIEKSVSAEVCGIEGGKERREVRRA